MMVPLLERSNACFLCRKEDWLVKFTSQLGKLRLCSQRGQAMPVFSAGRVYGEQEGRSEAKKPR